MTRKALRRELEMHGFRRSAPIGRTGDVYQAGKSILMVDFSIRDHDAEYEMYFDCLDAIAYGQRPLLADIMGSCRFIIGLTGTTNFLGLVPRTVSRARDRGKPIGCVSWYCEGGQKTSVDITRIALDAQLVVGRLELIRRGESFN